MIQINLCTERLCSRFSSCCNHRIDKPWESSICFCRITFFSSLFLSKVYVFDLWISELNFISLAAHLSLTPLCSCGFGKQAAEHVPQECPQCRELRKKYWSVEVTWIHERCGTKELTPSRGRMHRGKKGEIQGMVKCIMGTNRIEK